MIAEGGVADKNLREEAFNDLTEHTDIMVNFWGDSEMGSPT